MGLFLTRVDVWNTKRPEKLLGKAFGNYFLLNTNRIVDMKNLRSGYAKFLYHQAPDDRRCSPDYIECGTSIAVIRTYHDHAETSNFGTFSIFPGYDITETPVETTIEWADVVAIWQTPRDITDGVCHMWYMKNAFKRQQCLIDENSLLHVLAEEYV